MNKKSPIFKQLFFLHFDAHCFERNTMYMDSHVLQTTAQGSSMQYRRHSEIRRMRVWKTIVRVDSPLYMRAQLMLQTEV